MKFRAVTNSEKTLVSRLSEKLPDALRTQILSDIANACAGSLNSDSSIVRFEVAGYTHPTSIGRNVLVDGMAKDKDGADLEVILFGDTNNRLYELEIVRFDDGDVIDLDLATLEVF